VKGNAGYDFEQFMLKFKYVAVQQIDKRTPNY